MRAHEPSAQKASVRKSAEASVASAHSIELWRKSVECQATNKGAKGYADLSPCGDRGRPRQSLPHKRNKSSEGTFSSRRSSVLLTVIDAHNNQRPHGALTFTAPQE